VTKKYVHECVKYQLNLLTFYKFLEPKWLDSPKKSEQPRKIWSYSSGFAQKSLDVGIEMENVMNKSIQSDE